MTEHIIQTLQDAINVQFELHGVDAVFTPFGGSAQDVRIIPARPDEIVGLGDTRSFEETFLFDIRVSELADPAEGDAITYDGTDYIVKSPPLRDDDHRLVWTIETYPS